MAAWPPQDGAGGRAAMDRLRAAARSHRIAAIACLAFGAAGPATAEDAADRFALQRMAEGYIRIDKASGAVSFCTVSQGGLACAPATEERAELEKRIAELTGRVDALEARLRAAEARRPDAGVGAPPVAKPEEEPRIEQTMNFAHRALRRFFDMIRGLKAEGGGNAG
jgi:hypothetical protein